MTSSQQIKSSDWVVIRLTVEVFILVQPGPPLEFDHLGMCGLCLGQHPCHRGLYDCILFPLNPDGIAQELPSTRTWLRGHVQIDTRDAART